MEDMSYAQLKDAINKAASLRQINLIEEIMIPETNVFLCELNGKRFNIKYDINYGVSLEPLTDFQASELLIITKLFPL